MFAVVHAVASAAAMVFSLVLVLRHCCCDACVMFLFMSALAFVFDIVLFVVCARDRSVESFPRSIVIVLVFVGLLRVLN